MWSTSGCSGPLASLDESPAHQTASQSEYAPADRESDLRKIRPGASVARHGYLQLAPWSPL